MPTRHFIKVPPYPKEPPIAWCVCGSWPGGKCFKCRLIVPAPSDLFGGFNAD
jgi:hypothetical protein